MTVALDQCSLDDLALNLDFVHLERAALLQQVNALIEGSVREKAIFWLYFRQGFTAREISSIPAVHLSVKGVKSLIHRLTQGVRIRIGRGG